MSPSEEAGRIPGLDDDTTADAVSTTQVTAERLDPATYAELEQVAARYPQARSGLLPMLHLVQSAAGRITPEGIEACAEILGISAAEVSGVTSGVSFSTIHSSTWWARKMRGKSMTPVPRSTMSPVAASLSLTWYCRTSCGALRITSIANWTGSAAPEP